MQNAKTNILAAVTENLKKVVPNFEELLRVAEAGDAEAQYKLGGLFSSQYTDDSEVNAEAIRWYERAAQQGHATAQWVLAYDSTEDLDRDGPPLRNAPEEARKWMRMAAEQGHEDAIDELIKMYRRGWAGMPKNPDEAACWCIRAGAWDTLLDMVKHKECSISAADEALMINSVRLKAESGDEYGQRKYGNLLATGLPTLPINEEEAVKWHNLAATQHEDEYGSYLSNNDAKIVEIFRRHSDMCSVKLLRLVGQMYEEETGDENSDAEAIHWHTLSAEKGDALAQYWLALRFIQGNGVQQNDEVAASWYQKAAEQGLTSAQNNLAVLYEQGQGVPQSYPIAWKWFKRAAEQGDETAQYNLGLFYLYGQGVKANEKTAIKWFKKASAQDYLRARVALAAVTGDQRNLAQAVEAIFNEHRMADFTEMEDWADSFDDFKGRLETLINTSQTPKGEATWKRFRDSDTQCHWVKKLPLNARIAATLRGMLAVVGNSQDVQEAASWFELALNNGDIAASYYLAHLSCRHSPIHSDNRKALKYLQPIWRLDDELQYVFAITDDDVHSLKPDPDSAYSSDFNAVLEALMTEMRNSIKLDLIKEETRKQQLSFLSHTLSNASAGAQDTIRRAARLLGTVQADKPETLRRAMERLSGQIASLALIETLVASFKLYASDPDRVRESWDNEQAGDIAFVRVLALALRQVLTRLFTLPGHALDLRRLLPESGEVLAQEFVADIMVLDLESDAEAERLIAWVHDKLPFLELRVEDDASLRFAQGGARFVVVFAVLAEILTNAMKYASEAPITLACELTERRLHVACRNRVQARPLQALDSGGTGIAFLREICRIVGADIQDSLNESGQFEVVFTAKA